MDLSLGVDGSYGRVPGYVGRNFLCQKTLLADHLIIDGDSIFVVT